MRNWDLDTGGLQEMLITPRPTPVSPTPKGEMLINGPGRLIVGGGKPTIVLPGRAPLHGRQRVADLFRPLAKPR